MPRRGVVAPVGGAALILALGMLAGAGSTAAATRSGPAGSLASPSRQIDVDLVQRGSQAPTDAQCRAEIGVPCYSPQEIRRAYGVDQLLNKGYDGKGETIVIFDSFGSPTIASDLQSFDAGYGLPNPPSFKILSPLGTVPYDPTAIPDQIGWAAETSLDVEWAHAMAPDASIVLMTSPVDETEGVMGMPQFNQLENYALAHHLGQIWSQSWATTENTLFTPAGEQVFNDFESTYARADAQGVTVFASSGDAGTANPEVNGTTIYPFPTVNFPASSPLVTAVGGTSLTASTNGDYESPAAWPFSGGGISQKFSEPSYQRFFLPSSDRTELGGMRGIPDVSWNADPNTPILIYLSFLGSSEAGFYTVGGTSEGSPDWAGLAADLDQLAGHRLGLLNPYLYALGAEGIGFHDITTGSNSQDGVPGYSATPGWDLVTGWGTPDLYDYFLDIAFLARGNPALATLRARAESLRR